MNFTIAKRIRVNLQWKTVSDSSQSDWPFLQKGKISNSLRLRIKGPRIYRFYFGSNGRQSKCYIGESEKFERRCRDYLQVIQKLRTSKSLKESTLEDLELACKRLHTEPCVRVCASILNAEIDQSSVELQLLDFEPFSFNNVLISPENMTNPFIRKIMENLAILDVDAARIHIMNRGRDADMKWLTRWMKQHQRSTISY